MSLRAGNALDDYAAPPPYDPVLDAPGDAYFERYRWGLAHLDPVSWRYYLPRLMDHARRHVHASHDGEPNDEACQLVEDLLWSLRPPDRDPPRLASLSPEEEAAVTAFLEELAFGVNSPWAEFAAQVLEEYWTPGALYR